MNLCTISCIKFCNWLSIRINKMDKNKRSNFNNSQKTNFKLERYPSEEISLKKHLNSTLSTSTAYSYPHAAKRPSITTAYIQKITTKKTSIPKLYTHLPINNYILSISHWGNFMFNRGPQYNKYLLQYKGNR